MLVLTALSMSISPFSRMVKYAELLNKKPLELLRLAKSWIQPPELKEATGCISNGYDRAQRAYVLLADSPQPKFYT